MNSTILDFASCPGHTLVRTDASAQMNRIAVGSSVAAMGNACRRALDSGVHLRYRRLSVEFKAVMVSSRQSSEPAHQPPFAIPALSLPSK